MSEKSPSQPSPDDQPTIPATPRKQPAIPPGLVGERPGDQIGKYTILKVIGAGGMGIVFEAEQQHPRRNVALKLIRSGFPSAEMLRRFEHEANILAKLQHPGIAQVYEAGVFQTPDRDRAGLSPMPYFAMELIRGIPLTQYAEDQKLRTRQRLELLVKICDAVQHAHSRGIIHRDLKPGNILVDESGQPKILDFGIARATDSDTRSTTLQTDVGQLIGTLPYMSPEQAGGDPDELDTRSDVYALGVIAYEVLSGRLPYNLNRRMLHEVIRIIREEEPTRLSSIDRALRGDVEIIVGKALEKDKAHRYQTPADFAADLSRYLRDEPISARPPSTWYQLAKFSKRNKALVGGAAGVLLALIVGMVGTLTQARRADRRAEAALRAEDKANRALDEAQEMRAREAELRKKAEDATALATAKSVVAENALKEMTEAQAKSAEAEKGAAQDRQKAAELGSLAEFESYFANLHAADSAIAAGEITGARSRLELCPKELRGWEWRWLDAQCDTSLLVLAGHRGQVHAANFSSDGSRIVTASDDATARVWNAATGQELAVLCGHAGPVTSAAFSPSADRVLTTSPDKTVRIYETSSGKELAILRGHRFGSPSAAFSPSGDQIVSAGYEEVARLWDAHTGTELMVLRGHVGPIRSVAFDPSGTRVVTSSDDKTARVWNAHTGEELAVLRGHENSVWTGRFDPAGDHLVTAGWSDQTLRVWRLPSGDAQAVLRGHTDMVIFGIFDVSGNRIVSASWDNTAREWDATTGKELTVLRGHKGAVNSAAFSPQGERLVTASSDNTARLWDAVNGNEQAILRGHEGAVRTADFSPSGDRIATASDDKTARLWDGRACDVIRSGGYGVLWSDSALLMVRSIGHSVQILEASSGRQLAALTGHENQVRSASVSPGGDRIVTASDDQTARVWDASTGRELRALRGHEGEVNYAAFSLDGAYIVSASDDMTARVWDAITGVEIARLGMVAQRVPNSGLTCAQFSRDGQRVVTASKDGFVRVWTVAGAHEVFRNRHRPRIGSLPLPQSAPGVVSSGGNEGSVVRYGYDKSVQLHGHTASVTFAAFSADGSRVVSASADKSIRIWDSVSGKQVGILLGHDGGVTSAAFSPDGTRVASGSLDQTVRLWDTMSFRETLSLRGHTKGVISVSFSSDGTQLITTSWDGTARIWDSKPHRTRFQDSEARTLHK